MGIEHGIWIESKKTLDKIIQDARVGNRKVESLAFGSTFKSSVKWNNVLASLSSYLPALQHLTISQQHICEQGLREIQHLTQLKGLSLYWSGLGEHDFFDYLPDSLEYIDLSRTRACLNHSLEQLKKLLERLNNLQSLDLAETGIKHFPKLDQPNTSLKELQLFHHTIGERNHSLNDNDFENIFHNFPNLKKLNIIACTSISIFDKKTRKIIKAFANVDGFELYADKHILEYFNKCRNTAYFNRHYQAALPHTAKELEDLTRFGAKFLLEEMGIPPQKMLEMYANEPEKFIMLTSVFFIDCMQAKILSFNELDELYGHYGKELTSLINYESIALIKEKGVSFLSLLSLFQKKPDHLRGMLSFWSTYNKSKEMIEIEIAMLVKEDQHDQSTFKRLEQPNDSLKSFIVGYSRKVELTGNDILNILYSLPSLNSLKLHSETTLRDSEEDILLVKIAIEAHCLENPEFTLSYYGEDKLIKKLYQRALGMRFYTQTCQVRALDLYQLEHDDPKQFDIFMQTSVQSFMQMLSINIAALSALYGKYQDGLLKLTSGSAQLFLRKNILTFNELEALYTEDQVQFAKLINYSVYNLIHKHGITWEELKQVYAKNPDAPEELASFYFFRKDSQEVRAKIHQLLHVESVASISDSVPEADNEKERDQGARQLGFVGNTASFWYGAAIKTAKPAYTKEQAYLAAKWYLRIIEEKIPDIYRNLKYTADKMNLELTFTQKNEFIESLANSVWHSLQQDAGFNVRGGSPLYLNWSDSCITEALKQAKIDIDNTRQLNIFVFIGRKKTTYQLGNSVGDCNEYIQKAAPLNVEIVRPKTGMFFSPQDIKLCDYIGFGYVQFEASNSPKENGVGGGMVSVLRDRLNENMEVDKVNIYYELIHPETRKKISDCNFSGTLRPVPGNVIEYFDKLLKNILNDAGIKYELQNKSFDETLYFGPRGSVLPPPDAQYPTARFTISFSLNDAEKVAEAFEQAGFAQIQENETIAADIRKALSRIDANQYKPRLLRSG